MFTGQNNPFAKNASETFATKSLTFRRHLCFCENHNSDIFNIRIILHSQISSLLPGSLEKVNILLHFNETSERNALEKCDVDGKTDINASLQCSDSLSC